MRRLAAAVALALALAGGASADTFRIVSVEGDRALASAWTPNTEDSLTLPYGFLTPPAEPQRRSLGELQELWQRAGAAYGVPWQVLAAINKIESNFGQNMGPSSAGAIGWMQFMPETWLRWGTDADGDGIADPWSPEDAILSAARYLAAAGATTDLRRGIFAYNHADWYVDEVLEVAALYGSGGIEVAADLEELQRSVAAAGSSAAAAEAALAAARAEAQRLGEAEATLLAKAESVELLSDQLIFQKAAADAGAQRAAAEAVVAAREQELAAAEAGLAAAREQARTASFNPGARTLLGASYDSDGWVFPVGGGPSVVSVARDHHDYAAADIAAPEGAPLYAINDAVVSNSWESDPRCGIGFSLQTEDGRTWTYCHLSYLDPGVVAGAVLAAGDQVGLVGSTGRSTGPHLHLQLHPATGYPQEEPWFAAFAGTAFSWQGEAPPEPAAARSVFALVPGEDEPADDGVVYFSR